MKKVIRSTNDLLLAVLMGAASIFLLTSDKVITGVENGLGGAWAQASTYIHLLAGILLVEPCKIALKKPELLFDTGCRLIITRA